MEVMENKKYMIGDRVIADGEKSVILELHRTCAQVEPSFDLVDYGDIQPISLTAEILEKNGFKGIGLYVYTDLDTSITHKNDRGRYRQPDNFSCTQT